MAPPCERKQKRTLLVLRPVHPERVCWGCEKLCPANDLTCGNERSLHPCELFGDDWLEWRDSNASENG